MTSLGESEMQRNSEILLVECEHIFFFNQTCNGGCNIGLKFRNEKHEFIRTRLNDFASKTLFVLPDIFPVQVVLLKRFLPRKCYIVYLKHEVSVEQQNSKFAPRCCSPHVVVRPTWFHSFLWLANNSHGFPANLTAEWAELFSLLWNPYFSTFPDFISFEFMVTISCFCFTKHVNNIKEKFRIYLDMTWSKCKFFQAVSDFASV